ncbi:response regulator transcription factor [Nitrosopumilus sp.]|uniref:response regulator transcription factor n=1 Tax=Nitrosopumilus sp. TaxID=2024843 RepID=UPI00247E7A09|nr:response regulator [Nitrosopumilus sp.]MCV0409552.1 response regulator [Nitrosopumilus sp.]
MARKFPVILLADDSQAFRVFCRDAIKNSIKFIQIIEASDGIETLKQYQLHRPDVILLDLKMPRLEGDKVLEVIKKNDQNTKIIVTSAYGRDQEFINKLLKMGAISFVPKPSNRISLMKEITDVLAKGKMPGTNFTKSIPAS